MEKIDECGCGSLEVVLDKCPYQLEIHDNYTTCNCCKKCREECFWDI
jgi:hypothetical protein